MQARESWLHPSAMRMARHLAYWADEHGSLVDIPGVLAAYSAHYARGRRTAWADFTRLVDAGLVRQVCAAAPYRQARYKLCMDVLSLPSDLPRDLAAELTAYVDNPRVAARRRPTRADVHEALAECEVVRYGSATRDNAIMAAAGEGKLHTSPFTREGFSPLCTPPARRRPSRARQRAPLGQDRIEEQANALYFVRELVPEWARQRQGQVLDDVALAEVAELARVLLRRMPESEVAELFTAQVTSAEDLVGVLRWRTGRTMASMRRAEYRARRLVVDDDGSRHAAWLAANAARDAEQVASRRAELVELARRRAREVAEARLAQEQARLAARLYSG
ncbi:hypothetical protein DMB42_52045 [Nonomuraea sp. WAC 01424]|uniref:hypothetical protein n=1 Tax=Nonomuraea sp. WAC 01424 TaxID=2203200 RepID=UPI000F7AC050|nr:hypothetical protein [Nonomuraea sp. WAC 01424]RSM93766.1 hypothetical protein DMB42_52045 [Nonomuraea sp. WAC 01424]